ncbi:MAG TPA: alkaline phosphatase family protein, partial [Candidatus Polarisedimenticolaceae bacterium]|nr:alkaline phosphatase family protein [Candidatus Polarisedimenticolaceae bacterium]
MKYSRQPQPSGSLSAQTLIDSLFSHGLLSISMHICLRKIVFLACAIFAAAIPGATHGQTAKSIVLAWDGTVSTFVDELTRQGKLPNLAKLIAGGAFADDVRPGFPSKTAPGFASLMTGAPPRVTGISGNRVPREPRADYTILDSMAGFSEAPLLAEPIWAAAQRAGKKVVISHMPSFAAENSENTIRFYGYDMIAGRDGIVTPRLSKPEPATSWDKLPASDAPALEVSFAVAASKFFGLLVDDPADEQIGYDTLLLARRRNGEDIEVKLKSIPAGATGELFWSGPVEVKTTGERSASVYFRLFELRGDGSDFFLYFTRPARAMVTPEDALEGAGDTVRSFIGNGASILYQQGSFGRTIPSGGSGGAETRYLETVRFAQHQLMETNRWAMAHLPWDLFFAYTPFPDESEHLWRGYLDPGLSTYREEVAERLRPFLEQVYKTCDDHLGLLLANRSADTIIAVISDHGMQAANKRFAINRLLQQKGLLVIDQQGRINLSKTKVLYPSINNGYLLINSMDRKNGIVGAEGRKELARQIGELLSQVRDGDKPVVKNVYDAETHGVEMGIGGPSGGDVYIELVPGYDFDPRTTPEPVITQVEPYGSHGTNPEQSSMRTLMLFQGPEIAPG